MNAWKRQLNWSNNVKKRVPELHHNDVRDRKCYAEDNYLKLLLLKVIRQTTES